MLAYPQPHICGGKVQGIDIHMWNGNPAHVTLFWPCHNHFGPSPQGGTETESETQVETKNRSPAASQPVVYEKNF